MKKSKEEKNSTGTKKKRGFWGILSRIFLGVIAFFLVISLTVIILVQTEGFRAFLSDKISSIVNESIEGELSFSNLEIGLFPGNVSLDNVLLTVEKDTMVYSEKVIVDVFIEPILNQNIIAPSVLLKNPQVNFVRSARDSLWNFSKLAKPSKDTSKSSPPDWKIKVSSLKIENADIVFRDSLAMQKNPYGVDYMNMKMSDFNLDIRAEIKLRTNDMSFNIKKLNFKEENSGWKTDNISLNADINSKGIFLNHFEYISPLSHLEVEASLSQINIFEKGDIKNAHVKAKIKGNKIASGDLRLIAKLPIELSGAYILDFHAEGNLGKRIVSELLLETGSTKINLKEAAIENIFEQNKLSYEALFGETFISKSDIENILPFIDLKQIPDFKNSELTNTYIKGFTDSIYAEPDLKTQYGSISGNAGFFFGDTLNPNYSLNLTAERLNIAPFAGSKDLHSSLNVKIKGDGSGTDFDRLDAFFNIFSWDSEIAGYTYDTFTFKGNIKNKSMNFDSLLLVLSYSEEEMPETVLEYDSSFIFSSGYLDISDIKKPEYNLNLDYRNLNLALLFDSKDLPQQLSGSLSVQGSGINPDSLEGRLTNSVTMATFYNRSLFPFTAMLELEKFGSGKRKLSFDSEYLQASLEGSYNYNNFFSLLKNQGTYFGFYLLKRTNSVNPIVSKNYIDSLENDFEKITSFDPIEFTLEADVKDISIINSFIDDMEIFSEMILRMNLEVDTQTSTLDIDTLNIKNFQLKSPDISLVSTPVTASGGIKMSIEDSLPRIDKMSFGINCNDRIFFNQNTITSPFLLIEYGNDIADYRTGASYNSIIDFYSRGSFMFGNKIHDLTIDEFMIKYKENMMWTAPYPIVMQLFNQNIDVISFELAREEAETINIKGRIKDMAAENLILNVKNFPLNDLNMLLPQENETLKSFRGQLDDISFTVNGSVDNPNIKLKSSVSNIGFEQDTIGFLTMDMEYSEKNASGAVVLSTGKLGTKRKLIDITINSLPLNIPPDTTGSLFNENKMLNVKANTQDFPLEFVQLFLQSGIKNLKGSADITLDISGYAPNRLDISGLLKLNKSYFLLEPTNIAYTAKGTITLNEEEINIEKIQLANVGNDINLGGKAEINGKVFLSELQPDYYDINFSTDGLLVLSQESKRTMPDLFGDIVIGTGPKPVSFYGSLEKPNVGGDVKIIRANITLPKPTQQITFSTVHYKYSGELTQTDTTMEMSSFNWDSTMQARREKESARANKDAGKNLGNMISYDLDIQIMNTINALIELGTLQQVYAQIDVKDKTKPLHFVMERGSDSPKLFGNLIVKEGSKLDFFKTLSAQGEILFPTGDITNPGLDLKADYNGISYINNEQRQYTVTIYVKGTKEKPDIRFDYTIDGEQAVGDTSSIRENAMLLLLFGRTKAEFSAKSQMQNNIVSETVSSGASSLISSQITSILQNTGVITGADVEFQEGQIDFSNAKVTITGQIIGNVMWRFGGTVADFANNNEISIDIPIGSLHPVWMNNIILQLTRSINTATTNIRNANEWEIKMKFGGSW